MLTYTHNMHVPCTYLHIFTHKHTHTHTTTQTFLSNLEESTIADKTLVKWGLQFRENLTKKYKWDFSSEPEDYTPTIVET